MKPRGEMQKTLLLVWPLLLGMYMIMTGNGLQGTLLAIRSGIEGFSVFTTGIIMSLYYTGFLIGCLIVPRMVRSVGHIRVFAGLASLASTTILFHGIIPNAWVWGGIRILSGVSFAGLFIVAESWLNNIAPNKLRGRIFSSYIFVIQGGLFTGQFFINFAPPENITLFVFVSALISLSLMPVTLANKSPPVFQETENLPLRRLLKISPLAVSGVFAAGVCGAVFLSLGPFYAREAGMNVAHISWFMAAYILGCALLPLILGTISDRFDRRNMIIGIAFCAFCTGMIIEHAPPVLMLTTFILGGLVTSFYSISVAYMNDRLKPEQMVSASASLILINGFGASIGPMIVGLIMQTTGQTVLFFPALSAVCLLVMLIGIYRAFKGKTVNIGKQKDFQVIPARAGPGIIQITEEE